MLLAEVAAIIVSILYYRRHKELRVFTYYISFSFVQMWGQFLYVNSGQTRVLNAELMIFTNLFMLFEFGVGIWYIIKHLSNRKRRIAVYINAFIYLIFLLTVGIFDIRAFGRGSFFFFESFFMLLPCLLYFYEQFIDPRPGRLTDEPSFWIILGFMLLDAGSMPLYMAWVVSNHEHKDLYAANYILYIILSLLIIRAYWCPPANPAIHAAS